MLAARPSGDDNAGALSGVADGVVRRWVCEAHSLMRAIIPPDKRLIAPCSLLSLDQTESLKVTDLYGRQPDPRGGKGVRETKIPL